ncbi:MULTISPECIES: FG-GAP-like repeat-containing protein [unclassified Lentimicrobium]|uniref:FG-GAP-like repeat-containing protein n=1 Tax=unclassified Lentimicrobium TaxID=2677434 RepID=UPI001555A07F|nr:MULTISPECIES: FG-GAP-like repeat-containing protein [unclassified Lentimicrobium]NPD46639.1 hypothetical protein [Lentimicrobium sp. S6]NPD84764.1 hypothetical protein [Lentimicrobium sp. L6]
MNKKHDILTAKFFKVITIGLVIIALQVNIVKAQVSLITNGQNIQTTNSWDIKLVDINGDGHLDAYLGGKTWLNNGNGKISETDLSFGSGIFASFGDLNGDGFIDVVSQDSIYLNDGDNHYEFKIKLSSDILMYSSVLVDVDKDGDMDIISCSQTTDRILINDGKGNFTNTGKSLGGWGQASYTFGDINSDGFTDIYVAIPHTPPPAMKHSANKIWLGSAEKKFTERSHDISGAVSRNALLCDFDNDGYMDLFLASNSEAGNMIFFNDGKGNFTDSGQKLGDNSGSAKTADFDSDGDSDLFICHGKVPFGDGAPNKVWHNDGKGHFRDSKLSLGNSNSAAVALGDMNKDGKIDAVIVNVKLDPKNSYASVPCPVEIWFNNAFESNNLNESKDAYFGLTPPGLIPEVFAPRIVSIDTTIEHGSPTFSPDGKQLFWQSNLRHTGKETEVFLKTMRCIEGQWTESEMSPFGGMPAFSPDGQQIYFIALDTENDKGLYMSTKQNEKWSEPKSLNLLARFPELKYLYGPSVTNKGTLYFFAHAEGLETLNNFGIYRSELNDGVYEKPQLLPSSINMAGGTFNWTPFITPDESYILFSSNRLSPDKDFGDIYICFRSNNGNWTEAINLGKNINSDRQERFPYVSPDGKYLFFTRWIARGNEDIMWVSSRIIDDLKNEVIK